MNIVIVPPVNPRKAAFPWTFLKNIPRINKPLIPLANKPRIKSKSYSLCLLLLLN